jgi:hypothetical protein
MTTRSFKTLLILLCAAVFAWGSTPSSGEAWAKSPPGKSLKGSRAKRAGKSNKRHGRMKRSKRHGKVRSGKRSGKRPVRHRAARRGAGKRSR